MSVRKLLDQLQYLLFVIGEVMKIMVSSILCLLLQELAHTNMILEYTHVSLTETEYGIHIYSFSRNIPAYHFMIAREINLRC